MAEDTQITWKISSVSGTGTGPFESLESVQQKVLLGGKKNLNVQGIECLEIKTGQTYDITFELSDYVRLSGIMVQARLLKNAYFDLDFRVPASSSYFVHKSVSIGENDPDEIIDAFEEFTKSVPLKTVQLSLSVESTSCKLYAVDLHFEPTDCIGMQVVSMDGRLLSQHADKGTIVYPIRIQSRPVVMSDMGDFDEIYVVQDRLTEITVSPQPIYLTEENMYSADALIESNGRWALYSYDSKRLSVTLQSGDELVSGAGNDVAEVNKNKGFLTYGFYNLHLDFITDTSDEPYVVPVVLDYAVPLSVNGETKILNLSMDEIINILDLYIVRDRYWFVDGLDTSIFNIGRTEGIDNTLTYLQLRSDSGLLGTHTYTFLVRSGSQRVVINVTVNLQSHLSASPQNHLLDNNNDYTTEIYVCRYNLDFTWKFDANAGQYAVIRENNVSSPYPNPSEDFDYTWDKLTITYRDPNIEQAGCYSNTLTLNGVAEAGMSISNPPTVPITIKRNIHLNYRLIGADTRPVVGTGDWSVIKVRTDAAESIGTTSGTPYMYIANNTADWWSNSPTNTNGNDEIVTKTVYVTGAWIKSGSQWRNPNPQSDDMIGIPSVMRIEFTANAGEYVTLNTATCCDEKNFLYLGLLDTPIRTDNPADYQNEYHAMHSGYEYYGYYYKTWSDIYFIPTSGQHYIELMYYKHTADTYRPDYVSFQSLQTSLVQMRDIAVQSNSKQVDFYDGTRRGNLNVPASLAYKKSPINASVAFSSYNTYLRELNAGTNIFFASYELYTEASSDSKKTVNPAYVFIPFELRRIHYFLAAETSYLLWDNDWKEHTAMLENPDAEISFNSVSEDGALLLLDKWDNMPTEIPDESELTSLPFTGTVIDSGGWDYGVPPPIDTPVPDAPPENELESVLVDVTGEWIQADGHWESSNTYVHSSESVMRLTFTAEAGDELWLKTGVSSEAGWDNLYMGVLDTAVNVDNYADSYSGDYPLINGKYIVESSGTHYIELLYSKDGSVNNGNDRAYFYGLYKHIPQQIEEPDEIWYSKNTANNSIARIRFTFTIPSDWNIHSRLFFKYGVSSYAPNDVLSIGYLNSAIDSDPYKAYEQAYDPSKTTYWFAIAGDKPTVLSDGKVNSVAIIPGQSVYVEVMYNRYGSSYNPAGANKGYFYGIYAYTPSTSDVITVSGNTAVQIKRNTDWVPPETMRLPVTARLPVEVVELEEPEQDEVHYALQYERHPYWDVNDKVYLRTVDADGVVSWTQYPAPTTVGKHFIDLGTEEETEGKSYALYEDPFAVIHDITFKSTVPDTFADDEFLGEREIVKTIHVVEYRHAFIQNELVPDMLSQDTEKDVFGSEKPSYVHVSSTDVFHRNSKALRTVTLDSTHNKLLAANLASRANTISWEVSFDHPRLLRSWSYTTPRSTFVMTGFLIEGWLDGINKWEIIDAVPFYFSLWFEDGYHTKADNAVRMGYESVRPRPWTKVRITLTQVQKGASDKPTNTQETGVFAVGTFQFYEGYPLMTHFTYYASTTDTAEQTAAKYINGTKRLWMRHRSNMTNTYIGGYPLTDATSETFLVRCGGNEGTQPVMMFNEELETNSEWTLGTATYMATQNERWDYLFTNAFESIANLSILSFDERFAYAVISFYHVVNLCGIRYDTSVNPDGTFAGGLVISRLNTLPLHTDVNTIRASDKNLLTVFATENHFGCCNNGMSTAQMLAAPEILDEFVLKVQSMIYGEDAPGIIPHGMRLLNPVGTQGHTLMYVNGEWKNIGQDMIYFPENAQERLPVNVPSATLLAGNQDILKAARQQWSSTLYQQTTDSDINDKTAFVNPYDKHRLIYDCGTGRWSDLTSEIGVYDFSEYLGRQYYASFRNPQDIRSLLINVTGLTNTGVYYISGGSKVKSNVGELQFFAQIKGTDITYDDIRIVSAGVEYSAKYGEPIRIGSVPSSIKIYNMRINGVANAGDSVYLVAPRYYNAHNSTSTAGGAKGSSIDNPYIELTRNTSIQGWEMTSNLDKNHLISANYTFTRFILYVRVPDGLVPFFTFTLVNP